LFLKFLQGPHPTGTVCLSVAGLAFRRDALDDFPIKQEIDDFVKDNKSL